MVNKKFRVYTLIMCIILSNTIPVYAQDSFESEQVNSMKSKESVEQMMHETESETLSITFESYEDISSNAFLDAALNSDESETEANETVSFAIQDIFVKTDEIQTESKLIVRVIMNTTEGIQKAVLLGYAKEKGAVVQ